MCFLAMFVMEAFDSDLSGTGNSLDRYYKATNFMDLSMHSESFTPEDLVTIKALPSVRDVDFRYTSVGRVRLDGAEKKLEYNFIDSSKVSGMLLMEGVPYENGKAGIWIDRNFAAAQGISVGDNLQLKCDGVEFTETVMGIVDNPDHLMFVIDDTYQSPKFGAYGFAFLDSGEYPGSQFVFDTAYVDVEGVDNQFYMTEEDKKAINDAKLQIMEVLSKTSLSFVPKQKESGYSSTQVDMESDETLELVFPGVFSMIALLGIITTMTRLVMKQRTLIGTLKALGFSRPVVMVHYVSYSMVVALLGCIFGAIAGWYTLGLYLYKVMQEYYSIPYKVMELSENIFIATGIITAMAGLTNYFACRKLLVQRASDILRPEPPAVMGAGFLEKTPVWGVLDFASRWNLRDVNRNKMRTVAGLFGVLLCSAMLVVAFGANEFFQSVDDWIYGELTPAAYSVGFAGGTDYDTVYDYARMYNGQMVEQLETEVSSGDSSMLHNVFIVGEGNLYNFQDADGNCVPLPEHGIAVSSRLAEMMNIGMNDFISFRIPGNNQIYEGRVRLIYKTAGLQGLSVSRSFFESLGGVFRPTMIYTNMTVPGSYVTDREEVTSVFSKEQYIKTAKARRASMDESVTYIMAVAVIIGIVVMYNLGELSFIEKTREIATLKVLGFPTRKIQWILQQQNIFITGIGTVAGMFVGSKLLVFMMVQLDVDSDYIFPNLSIVPYILAFFLSFVLSLVVNRIISSKVKDINMVEALKGVE